MIFLAGLLFMTALWVGLPGAAFGDEAEDVSEEGELGETQRLNSSVRGTEDEEIVAAIAVVLALRSLDVSRSGLGTVLEAGRGPWWVMSQLQQRPTHTLTSQSRRQQ